jgi:K+-sensing histidine kinase KdpD
MSFHTATTYKTMTSDLSARLVSTVCTFADEKRLQRVDLDELKQMTVSFEQVSKEALMFGADAWPDSIEADLPTSQPRSLRAKALIGMFAALAVTVPLGFAVASWLGVGAVASLSLGVLAISLIFGSSWALTHSVLTAFAHNLFIADNPFNLTWPTNVEWVGVGLYLSIALMVPWLARRSSSIRRAI